MISQLRKNTSGFALLLTLIVLSVVLAIGLSLLSITLKQFTLSSTIRDSEKAFHAANTGAECVRYAVEHNNNAFFSNSADAPSIPCDSSGGWSAYDTPSYSHSAEDGGLVHYYGYRLTNTTYQSCLDISMYALQGGPSAMDYSLTNEGLDSITCEEFGSCTYVFSRGHNRACDDLSSLRVVQREITVDF